MRTVSDADHARIARALAKTGIWVEPVADFLGTLNLWPIQPCSTVEEVRAIAAYRAVTDVRIHFHDDRPKPVRTCVLCEVAGVPLLRDLCDRCRTGGEGGN